MPQFDFLKSISFFIKYRNTSIIARALIPAETMSNILPEKEEKLNINFIILPATRLQNSQAVGFIMLSVAEKEKCISLKIYNPWRRVVNRLLIKSPHK